MHAWNLRVPIQVSLEDKRFSYYIIKTFKLSNGENGLSRPFSSWQLLNLSSLKVLFSTNYAWIVQLDSIGKHNIYEVNCLFLIQFLESLVVFPLVL